MMMETKTKEEKKIQRFFLSSFEIEIQAQEKKNETMKTKSKTE